MAGISLVGMLGTGPGVSESRGNGGGYVSLISVTAVGVGSDWLACTPKVCSQGSPSLSLGDSLGG
jgi:hypothetical protein